MSLDPINPVPIRGGPIPPTVPSVRRVESSTEKQREEDARRRRKRSPTLPDLPPPPDDGRPHIDVRV